MAITVKKIIDDEPSRVVQETRKNLNALLDAIDAAGTTDISSLKAAVEARCVHLTTTRELPDPPRVPVL